MIQEIQLSNFKAFADAEKIPIKPITLVFGPNSSGKSSIFQSLLMLKQTIEEDTIGGEPLLLPRGKLIDLGNYQEFIHKHDESLSFSVTFIAEPPIDPYDEIPSDILINDRGSSPRLDNLCNSIQSLPIGITIVFSFDNNKGIHVSEVNLIVGNDPTPIITFVNMAPDSMESLSEDVEKELKRRRDLQWRTYKESPNKYLRFKKYEKHDYWKTYFKAIKENDYWINWKNSFDSLSEGYYDHPDTKKFSSKEIELLQRMGISLSTINNLFDDDFLTLSKFLPLELNGCYSQFLKTEDLGDVDNDNISVLIISAAFRIKKYLLNCLHIGPVRKNPDREFFLSGIISSYVGKNGQFMNEILVRDPELVNKVNHQLSNLNLGYQIKVIPLASEASGVKVSTIRLTNDQGVDFAITDVGYGISQVLPIILQSMLSRAKTILIEQPELHLHPAQQAELGDLFINAALGEPHNRFIIETHSEHLILRLLRRIRETTEGNLPPGATPLKPDQISVLYVKPGKDGSRIISLDIDEDGEFIEKWPDGFFAERAKELF